MKSLAEIQNDIRDLEKIVSSISSSAKNIQNEIEELRSHEQIKGNDYEEIKRKSKRFPFYEHPIADIGNVRAARLYLELLLAIIKFDGDEANNVIDNRLIFIQWILNKYKSNIELEDLIINCHKLKLSDFNEFAEYTSQMYREYFMVDLLIVANINGVLTDEEAEYIVDMAEILEIGKDRMKTLMRIAEMFLTQKSVDISRDIGSDFREKLYDYKFYIKNIEIEESTMRNMRNVVFRIPSDASSFKWTVKQHENVKKGDIIATYVSTHLSDLSNDVIATHKDIFVSGFRAAHKDKTSSISGKKEAIAPADGTLFRFRYNYKFYGILSYETDTIDAVRRWLKEK